MTACPTCGQERGRVVLGTFALLDILTNGTPHREVYRAQGGGWFVTYGGGEAAANAVAELVRLGKINSVYSNCPTDAYHVGRTMDCERTLEYRKGRPRKEWKIIYVDGGDVTATAERS